MRAELFVRTPSGSELREYGPVPMPAELAAEGLQMVRYYTPGGSGEYMIDGMVCLEAVAPAEPIVGGGAGRW